MKKYIYSIIWVLFIQLFMIACKEDEAELGTPPTDADAAFTVRPSDTSPNILELSSTSSAFIKKWDFGNGVTKEGNDVEATYPVKGTYEITLTVFTAGGSVSSKQTVEVEESDLNLLDPVAVLLSGGDAGKTWIIDKTTKGHLALGPIDNLATRWYEAGPNEKVGSGLYDDKYLFSLNGFAFTQQTNGDVFLNTLHKDKFADSYANMGDFTAPYTAPTDLTWSITKDASGNSYINISTGGFIGYYVGVSKYRIMSLTETELVIMFTDSADAGRVWYHRLITEGFTPPPPTVTTLPVTFEGSGAVPPFTGFGDATAAYSVVTNPSMNGINVSDKVAKYVKGTPNWSGITTDIAKIDFSTKRTFKMKVYSPVTGRALFKIEVAGTPTSFVEVFANLTKVNEWEMLTFDFPAAATDTYNKVSIFMDFDNNVGGTFYIDDIRQVVTGCNEIDTESFSAASGLNFTMATESFGAFGNIASDIVANPSVSGINTSCNVNSYMKTAGCETWSGTGYLLKTAIDFGTTTKKKFKLKVYAVDQVTTVTLRLERLAFPDVTPFAERTATITATGVWQELTFDFSDITDSNTYKSMIIYFERDSACDGDKYYFDDLVQIP